MLTQWFSLRRRLLATMLGVVALAWLATVVFSYVDAHHEVDELFDAQLAQSAQTLLALASHEDGDDTEDLGELAHKYQRQLRFQIWHADGRLLLRSKNAPETALTAEEGFAEQDGPDGHWRFFTTWNDDRSLQVQVGENHHVRDELIAQIAWRLLMPALFGLPLMGLGVWLATRRGLASLDELARQIARRDPQQLQPLLPASAPEEVRSMLEALNHLFYRVEQALEGERRFTADAAHELRTPLAALQAQLQVALRARDEDERAQSLAQLQSGLRRAVHLVDQMLQLARLDPESGLPDPRAVDLHELAAQVCADLGATILAKSIDFELQGEAGQLVIGQPDWLRILLRNLIDNAVRYTPAGGQIRVAIETNADSELTIAVDDSGPGIPVEQRAAVLQRFHRLAGAETEGSGLGLAIVGRIADLHGAQLSLGDSVFGPGLGVRVRLKAAKQASFT